MFRYGVQIALEQLPERMPVILRGEIGPVAELAAKIGYDALELYTHSPKEKNTAELVHAARENGLAYCGICTGLEKLLNGFCLTDDSAAARDAAIDRLKEHLDFGAALGCPVVVGTMRGNIPSYSETSRYLDRLSEGLRLLDAYAAQAGAELLIENILQYVSNYLNSIAEVGDYVRALALPHLKMHIDTHSMHMEDREPGRLIRAYGDTIGYVHFSDSNRAYPGGGAIDFKPYCHALLDIGYDGYITAECQPYPSQEICADRALRYMKAMEQLVLIEREPLHGESTRK